MAESDLLITTHDALKLSVNQYMKYALKTVLPQHQCAQKSPGHFVKFQILISNLLGGDVVAVDPQR